MTTPKTNGNGAKEVTPATNNKTNNQPVNGKITPAPKGEDKPTGNEPTPPIALPVVEKPAAPEPPKPITLEEQINYFLGLEKLVNIRRRFETHLEAVNSLEIEEDELAKFETGNNYGVRIELHDSKRREYNITNPKLVKEMLVHLASLLEGKINEYDQQILTYGQK